MDFSWVLGSFLFAKGEWWQCTEPLRVSRGPGQVDSEVRVSRVALLYALMGSPKLLVHFEYCFVLISLIPSRESFEL